MQRVAPANGNAPVLQQVEDITRDEVTLSGVARTGNSLAISVSTAEGLKNALQQRLAKTSEQRSGRAGNGKLVALSCNNLETQTYAWLLASKNGQPQAWLRWKAAQVLPNDLGALPSFQGTML